MRRPRSRSDEDLDAVDVLIVEDEAADEVWDVLRVLAREATALRAVSPGDPRPELLGPATLAWDDTPAPPPPAPARRVRRRHVVRAAMAAALVLAVAVTAVVVDARRTTARLAVLAASPGVLDRAATPPVERWRVDGVVVAAHDDVLLVADASARSLRAVDPATGGAVWTASSAAATAAADGRCFGVDEGLRPDRAPADDDGAGPAGLVACVADARPDRTPDDDGAAVRVVVLDAADGTTRHTLTADGHLLTAEPVDRDLLMVLALPEVGFRATRWDLATGLPRWDHVDPRPVVTTEVETADGSPADESVVNKSAGRPEPPGVVERRATSVTVGAVSLDLATGELLDTVDARRAPVRYEEHALPGGARATWSWRPRGDSGQGRVTATEGWRGYAIAGPPLRATVTDGSDGRVLVILAARGNRLRGLDVRNGRVRWSEQHTGASTVRATAVVDGVMVLDDGATVTARDVRSGALAWRVPVDPDVTRASALTDGEVVLLPERGLGSAPHLVARRLSDGAEVWRSGLPQGTVSLAVVDRHLVASTDDAVVGLR